MDYQYLFNQKFIILIVILIIDCLALLFFWVNNSYMDESDYLRNHPFVKYIIRVCLSLLMLTYFSLSALPIIKDKRIIDNQHYCVAEGQVLHDVDEGGMFGLSRSINISIDGSPYEFSVAFIDNDVKVGDEVKVTYLPNSKYAVIELE